MSPKRPKISPNLFWRLLGRGSNANERGPEKPASPERVAVIVLSDPGSTEYQRAERWLRDSEPMWQAIVESPFQYFMLLDRNGTIQYLNRMAPGIEFDDVIGKQTIYDFTAPDQKGFVRGKMEEVHRTGKAVHYQMHVPVLDEWFMVSAGPVHENGEIIGASVFAHDITEQKHIEEKLRESEQKYRSLIDLAGDGIALTDVEGRIVAANDSLCKIVGYAQAELLGKGFQDLIPEEDLINDPPEIEELKKGKTIVKERRVIRKDGTIVSVEGSFKALPSGLIQTILRDITDRKKAEKDLRDAHEELERRVAERTRELEAANEAYRRTERLASIGTLAAGIAHEINNPLGSILMAADMGLYSLNDPAEVSDALHSIKEDAKRAGRIVKTVLQFSRQEESQQWPHDLGNVAQRARDMTRSHAETYGVTVELSVDADLPEVVANPTEIEQVFVNIINNAIETSSAGQTVSVRVTADEERVFVLFQDRGHGMSAEETSRIFDPFYTTRHTEGGTGLGLSLTHSIVRQHGGSIDVKSELAKGTSITVNFPVDKDKHRKDDHPTDDR